MASVLRKAKAGIARAGHTIAGEVTELDWRIRDALHIGVQEEIDAAYLAATHRFGSFAPQRSHNRIKYYVDGKDYMAAVAEAIDNAKEVVFIMGWWVTPELHLRRPAAQYPQYRLDRLLKRKAEQGVHICVLVYKEVELALTINSEHTKTRLEALHPNIVVQRHPDHDGATGGTLFWAHHEKICLIDNTIAFMGGLDLCFGRWDTHDHSVVEFPYNSPEACWPGQDYSNPRIKDFVNVEQYNFVSVVNTARMPWHDVSMAIFGPSVLDLSRHYCERWNLLKKSKGGVRSEVRMIRSPLNAHARGKKVNLLGGITFAAQERYASPEWPTSIPNLSCNAQILRSGSQWGHDIEIEQSIQTAYIETIHSAQHFVYIENQFFITATDYADDNPVCNRIGVAIVERIRRAHREGTKFRIIVVMPLIPAFEAELSSDAAATVRAVMHWQYVSINRGGRSICEVLQRDGINPEDYIRFYSLRSYGKLPASQIRRRMEKQRELMEMELAESAENPDLQTKIIRSGGSSMASVFNFSKTQLPMPETRTNGAPNTGESVEEEIQGKEQRNAQFGDDRLDYVSEELYIHCKLLIADDRRVIMGSANLNDRSQCGDRDTEIACYIEDQDLVASQVDGKPFPVSRFATTLRRQLCREHLGILGEQDVVHVNADMRPPHIAGNSYVLDTPNDLMVQDVLSDHFWKMWTETAHTNTEVFRDLFHCVPDDSVTTWDQYHAFYPKPDASPAGGIYDPQRDEHDVEAQLARIHGHLVEFPVHFLEQENLYKDSLVNKLATVVYT